MESNYTDERDTGGSGSGRKGGVGSSATKEMLFTNIGLFKMIFLVLVIFLLQAKESGCEFSDLVLGFKLLESCNLSETDEKFVLTAADLKTLERHPFYTRRHKRGRSIIITTTTTICHYHHHNHNDHLSLS